MKQRQDLLALLCNALAIVSLAIILFVSAFLLASAWPALNLKQMLAPEWAPQQQQFGLLAMGISSALSSVLAVFIAFHLALLTAAACQHTPRWLSVLIKEGLLLLSGLPSVLLGLLGLLYLLPLLRTLFPMQTAASGGASLLAVICILSVVIFPGLTLQLWESLSALPRSLSEASEALGAWKSETSCFILIPALFPRVPRTLYGGICRAMGEAMAVLLVSGNVARMPTLFQSVRLLASGMVLEMGYATGLHQQALFAAGIALLGLIACFAGLVRLWERVICK